MILTTGKGYFLYVVCINKLEGDRMATKLKNLKVSKVDFVDEGANPGAHIRLFKRKDSGGQPKWEGTGKEQGNVLKKLLGFIGKAAGMGQDEIDTAVGEIQKSASYSFNERLDEAKNRKIADEIWDLCYALQSSLCSILNDSGIDSAGAEAAMQESLGEFMEVAGVAVPRWSELIDGNGNVDYSFPKDRAELIWQISGVATNVNQVAKHVNTNKFLSSGHLIMMNSYLEKIMKLLTEVLNVWRLRKS